MKSLLLLLSFACLSAPKLTAGGAHSHLPVSTPVATDAEPKSHPVKGVVVALLPEKTALLVKHEEVPGVMRAMTMMFKVEPAVLETVKIEDAITARMSRRSDGWWLHDVKVAPKG